MSQHLPECLMNLEYAVRVCICTELRVCEKRVLDAIDLPAANRQYQKVGYADGLDAAREAVDFVTVFIADVGEKGKPDLRQMIHVGSALAAIDALREDRQTPPPLPPSVGVPERRWT